MISMHFRMQINAAEQQEAIRLLTTPQGQQQDTAADAVDLKVLNHTLKQLQQETSQLKQLLNAEHSSPIQQQLVCQLGQVNAAKICGEHLHYRHRRSNLVLCCSYVHVSLTTHPAVWQEIFVAYLRMGVSSSTLVTSHVLQHLTRVNHYRIRMRQLPPPMGP